MSVYDKVPYEDSFPGLRIKRRLGQKIVIIHKGEVLIIQVSTFESGQQITLAFSDPENKFAIIRDEAFKKHGGTS